MNTAYLDEFVPSELAELDSLQNDIPRLAKDQDLMSNIEKAVRLVPTSHRLYKCDARMATFIEKSSVHLIVTSPPYWTLKDYNESEGQLGYIADYEQFLTELDKVWRICYDALVPGGRLICVVGDVCLSRRKNGGEHTVVPLHASIQEHCRGVGYSNLAPLIWHKISNASYEVSGGSSFLGKPYEPNAVIKNDIEYILMERKPGGYRNPSRSSRLLSIISDQNHKEWFQQIWMGIVGASTRQHPAPFPLAIAERLIRMFSFVGDTVVDPFMGTGTTNLAAAKWGRNSIGIEVDDDYFELTLARINRETCGLFATAEIKAFTEICETQ